MRKRMLRGRCWEGGRGGSETLSLSLTHTHTHTHTRARARVLTHTPTQTLAHLLRTFGYNETKYKIQSHARLKAREIKVQPTQGCLTRAAVNTKL